MTLDSVDIEQKLMEFIEDEIEPETDSMKTILGGIESVKMEYGFKAAFEENEDLDDETTEGETHG